MKAIKKIYIYFLINMSVRTSSKVGRGFSSHEKHIWERMKGCRNTFITTTTCRRLRTQKASKRCHGTHSPKASFLSLRSTMAIKEDAAMSPPTLLPSSCLPSPGRIRNTTVTQHLNQSIWLQKAVDLGTCHAKLRTCSLKLCGSLPDDSWLASMSVKHLQTKIKVNSLHKNKKAGDWASNYSKLSMFAVSCYSFSAYDKLPSWWLAS